MLMKRTRLILVKKELQIVVQSRIMGKCSLAEGWEVIKPDL